MSFTVRMATEVVQAEAGTNQPLAIDIVNRGDATDQFELEIEGLDAEWTAIPVPVFSVGAHETHQIKVFFKPDRTSENAAGNYPFVVKVRSLESGEARSAQGTLQIKPYFHITMEVLPKKGTHSPTLRQNTFVVTIMNLGNSELTLQLFGSEPEDALAYEFETEQVVVGPGQQKEITVSATPTRKGLFATSRLFGFTVSARSLENASVVAAAQAQLEQRPLVSPGSLAFLGVALFVLLGWFLMMPKAPTMDTLTLDRTTAKPGDTITIKWSSSYAKTVRILFGTEEVLPAAEPSGTIQWTARESGEFTAFALRDGRTSAPLRTALEVRQPEKAAPPEIASFDIDERSLEPGQPMTIKYKVLNAVTVSLSPTGTLLMPNQTRVQLQAPQTPGSYEYKISAQNASGDVAESRTITVQVAYNPKASILSFSCTPSEVDPAAARTVISWSTKGAERCQLKVGADTTDLPGTSGDMQIDVFESTDLVLVATDARGLTTRKKIRVTVKAPVEKPKPVNPPDDTDPGGSGTTGLTGTTGSTGTGSTGTTGTTGAAGTTGGRG